MKKLLVLVALLVPCAFQKIQACNVCYAQAMDEADTNFARSYERSSTMRHGTPEAYEAMSDGMESEMGTEEGTPTY